ncbi:MAG: hypothetical protein JKX84_05430, partial [Flavobacteriales bacterium]|nr:hypothetical protein [Flavobacteriales bacterium]
MKKQFYILTAFSFLFAFSLQAQELEWAKQFGGWGFDSGIDIAVDPFDNIYTIGEFNYTVDFDSGLDTFNLSGASTGFYQQSAYLSKTNTNGEFLWALSIGNEDDYVIVKAMELDPAGNICIIGMFNGTVDFDPGEDEYELSSFASLVDDGNESISSRQMTPVPIPPIPPLPPPPPTDIFVLKLNSEGGFVWAKSTGSNQSIWSASSAIANALDVDAQGNTYITGAFYDTLSFDVDQNEFELAGNNYPNTFICKYNATGELQWTKQFEGVSNSFGYGNAIAVDEFNNTFVFGEFSGQVDFNPSTDSLMITSNGQRDIFLTKLDQSGNLLWTKTFGGSGSDIGNDLKFDYDGNLFMTGHFSNTVVFDADQDSIGLTSTAQTDVFVLKMNGEGEQIWLKQLAGNQSDRGTSIAIDAFGNLVVTGIFGDFLDVDPGPETMESDGSLSTFHVKLDVHGNFIWGNSIDGISGNVAPSVRVNAMGDVFATGAFKNMVN